MEKNGNGKAELVAELATLRRYVAELEEKLAAARGAGAGCPAERPPRSRLDAEIECMGDFDVLRAKGVNISEEGICFEVEADLPFEMRFDLHGRLQTRRAHCMWVRRVASGRYHFGLKFVPPEPEETSF